MAGMARMALRLAGIAWFAAAVAAATAAPMTVEITLSGRAVSADIHAPTASARGTVVLVHGFLRSRENMAGHAQMLAADGYFVVVPDLPSRIDSRENGRALRELVARVRTGTLGPAPPRIVLAGFSAGGLSALLAADAPGVVGYVGLDAFDRPGGVGLEAARVLRTKAVLLRGPSSFCNAYGIAEPWGGVLPDLVATYRIAPASHCDFEAPTDRWCTLLCGATDEAAQQSIRARLREAVAALLGRAPSARDALADAPR